MILSTNFLENPDLENDFLNFSSSNEDVSGIPLNSVSDNRFIKYAELFKISLKLVIYL